jgi:hypothetical protein
VGARAAGAGRCERGVKRAWVGSWLLGGGLWGACTERPWGKRER